MQGVVFSMGAAVNDVFRAIADPTRRDILMSLGAGPRTVSEICRDFRISQPSVSTHLDVLRGVGLVSVTPVGRYRYYSLELRPLDEVVDWLSFFERFWKGKLKALGRRLDDDADKAATRARKRVR